MKILLLGANGQVGWECQRSLSIMGQLDIHDRETANFQDLDRIRKVVRDSKPDVIVNAAAYTAVDQAETDREAAIQINTKAVSLLAEEAKMLDACLIHYSTDYVFDGKKQGFYSEQDVTNPESVYGQSKLNGELAILNSGCQFFILRTSWVYAVRGNNFAKTIIKLAKERGELRVVNDQVGAPTSADLIADVTAQLVYQLRHKPDFAKKHSGIFNLVAGGEATWFDFARQVLKKAQELGLDLRVQPDDIVPVSTAEFPRPAPRPANSRLDTSKLTSMLNISLPTWQFHVDKMMIEFLEKQS